MLCGKAGTFSVDSGIKITEGMLNAFILYCIYCRDHTDVTFVSF